jgi:uncharacterized protein DUF6894
MAHYYFDLRDEDGLVPDEEGMELSDLQAVQEEAARSLAGFAWDSAQTVKDSQTHQMRIEVRDGIGPVMHVTFTFRFNIIRKQ